LGDTFLIVAEGNVTERQYLNKFCKLLKLGSTKVHIPRSKYRDPEGLIEEARRRRSPENLGYREPAAFDHVWVVFDTDQIPAKRFKSVHEYAKANDIHVAWTTPCIEFWLLLHYVGTPRHFVDCRALEEELSQHWGKRYDKRERTFLSLWLELKSRIPTALANAAKIREHHRSAETPPPANPSTNLDTLILALAFSARPELRGLLLGVDS